MQKIHFRAHLVCAWAELSCVETLFGVKRQVVTCFWRLTPKCSMELALNASLRRLNSDKVWTIIYCWKALDVYFPTQLRAHHLEFCSSRKSTLSAGRSESNSMCSPSSTSESDFCSSPSISARNYLKSQKTHKLIVKSRNVNLT